MLSLFAFVTGFIIGAVRAKKDGGNKMDMAQYGAAHGLAFTLAVLVIWVVGGWMGWF